MNRGMLNSYSINARGVRGGAVRVAADLIGQAYVAVKSRVLRHLTGPMVASAHIGPVVGRRVVRSPFQVVGAAVSTVISVPRIRATYDVVCQAVVDVAATVALRALLPVAASAQIELAAYAVVRGTANFDARAQLPEDLTSLRISPTMTTGSAAIALRAGVMNQFPYDEDAPDDRVFLVAPEDNIFYVAV